MDKYIQVRTVKRILTEAKDSGRVFSVSFVKRTNGELRRMICRGRVRSKSAGTGADERPYIPEDYNLTTVYDMLKRGFRSIPLDSVVQIKVNGEVY